MLRRSWLLSIPGRVCPAPFHASRSCVLVLLGIGKRSLCVQTNAAACCLLFPLVEHEIRVYGNWPPHSSATHRFVLMALCCGKACLCHVQARRWWPVEDSRAPRECEVVVRWLSEVIMDVIHMFVWKTVGQSGVTLASRRERKQVSTNCMHDYASGKIHCLSSDSRHESETVSGSFAGDCRSLMSMGGANRSKGASLPSARTFPLHVSLSP